MLKWCLIVGIFSFRCVQCWDKLPYSLKFKCWDLSGAIVNIIIPWGKKTMISEEFREVILPFSTWRFLEAILRMLPSSWTSPLQHKVLPHFRDPQVQHHLLRASYFGDLRRGHGTVVGVVNTPGRAPNSAVVFQPWATLLSHTWSYSVSLVPWGSLKQSQNSTLWGTESKPLPTQAVNSIIIFFRVFPWF